MNQIKIFTGLEDATEELTRDINQWLRESGAKVLQITGNIAPQSINMTEQVTPLPGSTGPIGHRLPSDIMIVILYSEE